MRRGYPYAGAMPKTIQVRDVPDRVHRILKVRAAREGVSLSSYVRRELAKPAEIPAMREWMERARKRSPVVQ